MRRIRFMIALLVTLASAAHGGQRVIVVSIDGLRAGGPYPLEILDLGGAMPGASVVRANSSVGDDTPLAWHATLLTGVLPPIHRMHGAGFSRDRGVVRSRSIFDQAIGANLTTFAVSTMNEMRHFERPGTLTHSRSVAGSSSEAVRQFLHGFGEYRPDLAWLQLGEARIAGETAGFATPDYIAAVRRVREALVHLASGLTTSGWAETTTVILVTDACGPPVGAPFTRAVTAAFWGSRVKDGRELVELRPIDVAPTAMWLLGLRSPDFWRGKPHVHAFAQFIAAR